MRIMYLRSDVGSSDLFARLGHETGILEIGAQQFRRVDLERHVGVIGEIAGDGRAVPNVHRRVEARSDHMDVFDVLDEQSFSAASRIETLSSEERRVGQEGVSTDRTWWEPYHKK